MPATDPTISTNANASHQCAICLTDMENAAYTHNAEKKCQVNHGHRTVQLACGHHYHTDCIKNQLTSGTSNCSVCRHPMSERDIEVVNSNLNTHFKSRTSETLEREMDQEELRQRQAHYSRVRPQRRRICYRRRLSSSPLHHIHIHRVQARPRSLGYQRRLQALQLEQSIKQLLHMFDYNFGYNSSAYHDQPRYPTFTQVQFCKAPLRLSEFSFAQAPSLFAPLPFAPSRVHYPVAPIVSARLLFAF